MLPTQLETHQDVISGLKHFEYENPVPLSRKPSEAIRQAIADVRHVVSKQATVQLSSWGELTDEGKGQVNCHVCLAGAVLLARGYFGRRADRRAALPVADVRPGCRYYAMPVHASIMREEDTDATEVEDIACSFNNLRLGLIMPLLRRARLPENDVTASIAVLASRAFHGHDIANPVKEAMVVNGSTAYRTLSDASVEALLTKLNRVADYLESQGH